MHFKLAEGDWLLLLSDGIAEARNADGQLFGFERVEQLLQAHPSAAIWPPPRRASASRTTSASSR